MVPAEIKFDNKLESFNQCPSSIQELLPGFNLPQQFIRWIQNDESKVIEKPFPELFLQSHLYGEHLPSVETFELIKDIESYINPKSVCYRKISDSTDLVDKYKYFRDKRRESAERDTSDYMLRLNKSFVKFIERFSDDNGVAEQFEEDQEEADASGKAEYFMTENSIIFLHPLTWSRKKVVTPSQQ